MKNKILYTVLLILTIFALVSCENEPIFYNIAKEVPLLDSVVTGNVYSMVEQGNYLFAANGKIFRKGKNEEVTPQVNPWKSFDKPEGAIIKLASTDNYLYALSVHPCLHRELQDYILRYRNQAFGLLSHLQGL